LSEEQEAHERRIDRCGSCQAPIIWLLTKNLRPMPVNAETVKPEESRFDPERHSSHFATCPNAKQHRRRR